MPQRLIAALGVDMETFEFRAECVVLEDPDGNGHFAGLADDGANPDCYVIISKAFEYEEQDYELGMDSYYLECLGQEHSGYGGVKSVALGSGYLEINFDSSGIGYMNGLEMLRVTFDIDMEIYSKLKRVIERIFEGSACDFRVAA